MYTQGVRAAIHPDALDPDADMNDVEQAPGAAPTHNIVVGARLYVMRGAHAHVVHSFALHCRAKGCMCSRG